MLDFLRIQLLDDVEFEWESDVVDVRWMEKYKELCRLSQ